MLVMLAFARLNGGRAEQAMESAEDAVAEASRLDGPNCSARR